MANIGGNIKGMLQGQVTSKNAIGQMEKIWHDEMEVIGWLGLSSGEKRYGTYAAKLEESTHIFLCDYNAAIYVLADKDLRMLMKGSVYDVLLIDNPDEMNEQLEIYLKRTGTYERKSSV